MDDLSDEIQALLWPFLDNQGPQTLADIGFDVKVPPGMMHKFVRLDSLQGYRSGKPEGILDGTFVPYGSAEQKNNRVDARKKSVDGDSSMPKGLVKKVDPKALKGKLPGSCDKCFNPACNASGVRRSLRAKAEAKKRVEKNGTASTGGSTSGSNQQQNDGKKSDGKQIAEEGPEEKK